LKLLKWFLIIFLVVFINGCVGKKAETEPSAEVPALQPPRLDMAADPGMYKAMQVIKDFGKKSKDHLTYSEFRKTKKTAVFDPDVFYDHHVLDLNEKDYWITITYRSAVRSIRKDSRIEKLMENLPRKVIDVQLKTPQGKTFLLSDSNADGVLDFASPAGKKKRSNPEADLKLLKNMQGRYRWVLSIIKKYYKKK